MSKSACPLYYPSNEVIAFTAGSAEVAARIHGPVFPCQEIKKGDVTKFIPTKRALPRIIWSGAEPFVL